MKKSIYLILLSIVMVTACHQKQSYSETAAFADMAMEEEIMPITRQQEVAPTATSYAPAKKPGCSQKENY